MKLAVSFLKTPYTKEETIAKIEQTSADFIHVDLTDGLFVEDNNFSWEEMWILLKNRKKPLDIHLMTLDVEHHIKNARSLKPESISFQWEATKDIKECIELIKEHGIKCGIAMSPSTAVEEFIPYLEKIDYILVLSVEPGRGGQKFIPETIDKLKELKKYQDQHQFLIEVDGGINAKTIELVKDYADILVSGSYICESNDFEERVQFLKKFK